MLHLDDNLWAVLTGSKTDYLKAGASLRMSYMIWTTSSR